MSNVPRDHDCSTDMSLPGSMGRCTDATVAMSMWASDKSNLHKHSASSARCRASVEACSSRCIHPPSRVLAHVGPHGTSPCTDDRTAVFARTRARTNMCKVQARACMHMHMQMSCGNTGHSIITWPTRWSAQATQPTHQFEPFDDLAAGIGDRQYAV